MIFLASEQQHIWLRTAHPDSESDTTSCGQEWNGEEEEEVEEGREEEMEGMMSPPVTFLLTNMSNGLHIWSSDISRKLERKLRGQRERGMLLFLLVKLRCNHAKGVHAWLNKAVCSGLRVLTLLVFMCRCSHANILCVRLCYVHHMKWGRSSSSRIRGLTGIMQDAGTRAMYFICFFLILSDGMCHIHPPQPPPPTPLPHATSRSVFP